MKFSFVKIRFTFEALQDIKFPAYAGSTLRGSFGNSLKKISCLAQKSNCKECAVVHNCPYVQIFENNEENQKISNPYIVEPMDLKKNCYQQGDLFSFDFILFGNRCSYLPYVILSLQKASQKGFCFDRIPAKLSYIEQVFPNNETALIYDFEDNEAETSSLTTQMEINENLSSDVVINISTPMRIHHDNHPVRPENLTAKDFLISLLRRQQSIFKYYMDEEYPDFKNLIADVDQVELEAIDLRWYDWKRYSNRQKTKIALGGIIGTFKLKNIPEKLFPWLSLGQYTHVGKSAVMGMGKYKIIE